MSTGDIVFSFGRLALVFGLWAGTARPVRAQQLPAPRDTSLTVASAFAKARKAYPTISIARPAAPTTIQSRLNQPYCTLGSRALLLDVFYPKARRKKGYPAVLFVHGGGWRSGDWSQHVPMAQQLAARGYVTATTEYRLSTERVFLPNGYCWRIHFQAIAKGINRSKAAWRVLANGTSFRASNKTACKPSG